MDTKSRVVLITGVRGLIGSNLAKWILKTQTNTVVIGIDNCTGGLEENAIKQDTYFYRFHKMDCTDEKRVGEIFRKWKPDIVFHCAAFAAEGLSPFMRKQTIVDNNVATSVILTQCIKYNVERFVYFSSSAVYGEVGIHPCTEFQDLNPIDPYGVSKLACEKDIQIAWRQHGLKFTILRPHNVYGPGQNIFDPYRNVLGIWMYRYLHGKSIRVYGTGEQTRCFTYIEDILEPIWKSAFIGWYSAIFNLGDTPPVSLKIAAETVKDVIWKDPSTKEEPWIEYCTPRYEAKYLRISGEQSKMLLGFQQNINFREGVERMWYWAKTLKDRSLQKVKYELERGIYPYWS